MVCWDIVCLTFTWFCILAEHSIIVFTSTALWLCGTFLGSHLFVCFLPFNGCYSVGDHVNLFWLVPIDFLLEKAFGWNIFIMSEHFTLYYFHSFGRHWVHKNISSVIIVFYSILFFFLLTCTFIGQLVLVQTTSFCLVYKN